VRKFRTSYDMDWHQPRRGHFVIPAGTSCQELKPSRHEKKIIDKDRKRGVSMVLVKLSGRRRFVRKGALDRVL